MQQPFSRFAVVRPAVRRMHGYVPGEQPRELDRYIKINSNENPYPPSPHVMRALQQAVGDDSSRAAPGRQLRIYPSPSAEDVRRKAAEVYGLEPDQVLVGNGSDDLLTMLMRTCIDPGDRVAYPVPTYSLYDILVAMQDGRAVHVPLARGFFLAARGAGREPGQARLCCQPKRAVRQFHTGGAARGAGPTDPGAARG